MSGLSGLPKILNFHLKCLLELSLHLFRQLGNWCLNSLIKSIVQSGNAWKISWFTSLNILSYGLNVSRKIIDLSSISKTSQMNHPLKGVCERQVRKKNIFRYYFNALCCIEGANHVDNIFVGLDSSLGLACGSTGKDEGERRVWEYLWICIYLFLLSG